MKPNELALIVISTLMISIVASLQVSDLVSANYFPPPSIEIYSPISVRIYNESSVQLYVRVNALPSESSSIIYVRYCLDGKANITLNNLSRKDGEAYWTSTPGVIATGNAFGVNSSLNNLAEGKHSLTIYAHAADGKEMSRSVEFTVDYDYVPPQNPFGLPNGRLPNGTAILPVPPPAQTETLKPTTNTGAFRPLENPVLLPFIFIAAFIAVSLLATVLYFSRKSQRRALAKQGL